MVGPNMSIKNENNVLLANNAKKIFFAIKGIRVSICEK
jgi:hypothetical protein